MNAMMQGGLPTYDDTVSQANQARYAMDSKLYVQFYVRPVMNNFRSSEEGRPIYEEKEYIRIIVPGDSKTTVDCPVTDEFRMRFQNQYDKFKRGLAQAVEGTPLEMWPVITRSQVEELKHFRVRTVEDLAGLADSSVQNFMGLVSLKNKAKAFLEAASGNGGAKFQAAIEQKDAQIATLEKMVRDQSEKIEQLLKAKR